MHCHIAICDDRETDRDYLAALVRSWGEERGHTLTLELFPSAEAFLFRYAEEKGFDLLLLDVEMGPMDGVALAKAIRRENAAVQMVFVTGYTDYIAQGYEVEALHYLMKPVGREKLAAVLDRAVQHLRRNERALLLEVSGEMVRLPQREVRYLEVRQNYVTVHAGEDYTVKQTLGHFAETLDDRFFRAGRSYLVNLEFIRRVTRTEIHLTGGEVIPLPRGMYEPINRAIISRN